MLETYPHPAFPRLCLTKMTTLLPNVTSYEVADGSLLEGRLQIEAS